MRDDRLLIWLRRVNALLAVGCLGSTVVCLHQLLLWRRGPSLPVEALPLDEPAAAVESFAPIPPLSQYESAFQRPGLFASLASPTFVESSRADGRTTKAVSPNRSALRLLGILHGVSPQAVIAGPGGRITTAGLGEQVEEFLVLAIEPGRVILDDDGESFALTF